MARLRVFISSTYYDLKYIRNNIEQFVESLGYEATVYESGDIPFSHDIPLDESCYREIGLCHMLVLVIGGRYGSGVSSAAKPKAETDLERLYEHYNSVTKREYQIAKEQDLPIYIFVEKGVLAEYETYKKNKNEKIRYAHVDSVNIFKLLDEIFGQARNNLVREFSTADDITSWLRDQWSGLFANFISQRKDTASVSQIKAQIESLSSVVDALKTYSEQIVRTVVKKDSESIISKVDHEIEAKQSEIWANRVRMFSHLINAHEVDPKILIEILKKSNSFAELVELLKTELSDVSCGVIDRGFIEHQEIRELNMLRRKLGLKMFRMEENQK